MGKALGSMLMTGIGNSIAGGVKNALTPPPAPAVSNDPATASMHALLQGKGQFNPQQMQQLLANRSKFGRTE